VETSEVNKISGGGCVDGCILIKRKKKIKGSRP